MQNARSFRALGLIAALSTALVGCNSEEVAYQPKPAPSSVRANLPAPPNVPQNPIKSGDAWTVWGASFYLRSRVHREELNGKDIKLTGYITKTNLSEAPECAVHETGKEDPEGCEAPVPTFWLGDSKDTPDKDAIRVMGWASNFAQLYDAMKEFKKAEKAPKKEGAEEEEPLTDAFWGVKIPNPIPAKGAKVTVKGNYSNNFTKATRGAEADPIMGIMTYEDITVHEEAPEVATLPGMRL